MSNLRRRLTLSAGVASRAGLSRPALVALLEGLWASPTCRCAVFLRRVPTPPEIVEYQANIDRARTHGVPWRAPTIFTKSRGLLRRRRRMN